MPLNPRFGIAPHLLMDGERVAACQCPTCWKIFPIAKGASERELDIMWDMAIWCHARRCKKCEAPSETLTHGGLCQACDTERANAVEVARIEKAKKVDLTTYRKSAAVDVLYDPHTDTFVDADTLAEHVYENYVYLDLETPVYMWGVEKLPLKIDVDAVIERVVTDNIDNVSWVDRLVGVDELRAAVKKWEDAQTVYGMAIDHTVLVDLENEFVGVDWEEV